MASVDRLDCSFEEFERGDLLGSGGNADVHEASVIADGRERTVALKTPRMTNYDTVDDSFFDEFVEEAEIWAQIDDHDDIVSVLGWGSDPYPWIALEYMEAGNLDTAVDDCSLAERARLFEQVCEAVFYAHRHGITHGDLKPENVLLTRDDGDLVAKIGDWGLANVLLEHSQSTDGLTLAYSAPEQVDADEYGRTDDRTDVYQLGAIAYELFAGRQPHDTDSTAELVSRILTKTPTPPSAVNSDLPASFDDPIVRSLSKDKDDRYDTVAYLRDAIRHAAADLDGVDADERPGRPPNHPNTPPPDAASASQADGSEIGSGSQTERAADPSHQTSVDSGAAGREPSEASASSGDVDATERTDSPEHDGGWFERKWAGVHRSVDSLDFTPGNPVSDVRFAFAYPRTADASTVKRGTLMAFLTILYGIGSPFMLGYLLDVVEQTARGEPISPPAVAWRQQFTDGIKFLALSLGTLVAVAVPGWLDPSASGALSSLTGFGLLVWLYAFPAVFVTYGVTRSARTALSKRTLRLTFTLRYLGLLVGGSVIFFAGYLLTALAVITIVGGFLVGFLGLTALAAYVGRRFQTYEFPGAVAD